MNKLTTSQRFLSVVVGLVFWLIFLFVIRNTPFLFDGGIINLILFIVSIPLIWFIVSGLKSALSFSNKTIFEAIVIATFTYMLCDGTVFSFVPEWYGKTEVHVRRGAGFILWGAAWGIIASWIMYLKAENDGKVLS